jgi:hypothetical protein
VRAQNCTVPVALTPKLADPGPPADDDAAGVVPEDEQPAATPASRATAEKSTMNDGLLLAFLFMCGSFKTSSARRRSVRRSGLGGAAGG